MAFLDPKKQNEDDELPGGSGLQFDLDVRICPECRRESMPWQDECANCGIPTVAPADLPAQRFVFPAFGEDPDDPDDDPDDPYDLHDPHDPHDLHDQPEDPDIPDETEPRFGG